MWLHASRNWIPVNDWILSPLESGLLPSWSTDAGAISRAEVHGWYRRDRVYVFEGGNCPVDAHVDRFTFVTPRSFVYHVEPDGVLEPDPDPSALTAFRACRRARVIECLLRPSATAPLDVRTGP